MPTMPGFVSLRNDQARDVLRTFKAKGVTIVKQARSPHGSDCDCSPEHLAGPMGHCRCVRVMRLRVLTSGDWLLVFGDANESQSFKLMGPYTYETELSYGGGFWEKRSV